MSSPLLIAIAGGTASGKSTVAAELVRALDDCGVSILLQDSYYLDRGHLTPEEQEAVNYDEPAALDFDLMRRQLGALARGETIAVPVYSYDTHTRAADTVALIPGDVVLFEGLFTLWDEELRALMDLSIFLDAPADVRFIRRLQRDIRERGRTVEATIAQYLDTVRPMHEQYVEPGRRYAEVVMRTDRGIESELNALVRRIRAMLDRPPRGGTP